MHINDTGGYPASFCVDDAGVSAKVCRWLTHGDNFAIDKVEARRVKLFSSPGENGRVCNECWRVIWRFVRGREGCVCSAHRGCKGGRHEGAYNEPDLVQMLHRIYLRLSTARR